MIKFDTIVASNAKKKHLLYLETQFRPYILFILSYYFIRFILFTVSSAPSSEYPSRCSSINSERLSSDHLNEGISDDNLFKTQDDGDDSYVVFEASESSDPMRSNAQDGNFKCLTQDKTTSYSSSSYHSGSDSHNMMIVPADSIYNKIRVSNFNFHIRFMRKIAKVKHDLSFSVVQGMDK